jgi:acetyl-CoA carboxylase biotin carboxyl carrier protein
MGIFWRSPSPGAPPFVSVGDPVTEETTVCIIEVMKLMHRVPAGVRGTVVQVAGTNGEPVETGDVLFRINPSG